MTTALDAGYIHGHRLLVDWLLEAGARDGAWAAERAAMAGDLKMLKQLSSCGWDINTIIQVSGNKVFPACGKRDASVAWAHRYRCHELDLTIKGAGL